MKHLIAVLATTTLLAGTALAQTATHNEDVNPAQPAQQNMGNGMQNHMGTTQNGVNNVANDQAARFVTPGQTDFVASSLINTKVYNLQDENIGDVRDVLIRENEVEAIVIGVGGFLGMGEHYVAVDPSSIRMTERDGAWHIATNTTKEALQNAPEFKYEGRWAR